MDREHHQSETLAEADVAQAASGNLGQRTNNRLGQVRLVGRKIIGGRAPLGLQIHSLHAKDGDHRFGCSHDHQPVSRRQPDRIQLLRWFAITQQLDDAHVFARAETGLSQCFTDHRRTRLDGNLKSILRCPGLGTEFGTECLAHRQKFRGRPYRVENSDDGQRQTDRTDFKHSQRWLAGVVEQPAAQDVCARADQGAATSKDGGVGKRNQKGRCRGTGEFGQMHGHGQADDHHRSVIDECRCGSRRQHHDQEQTAGAEIADTFERNHSAGDGTCPLERVGENEH